jgi:hypothetical protein
MAVRHHLHLWRAVLIHGLSDAAKGDCAWLGSPDFYTVCNLAGVDPGAVLRAYAPDRFKRLGKVA